MEFAPLGGSSVVQMLWFHKQYHFQSEVIRLNRQFSGLQPEKAGTILFPESQGALDSGVKPQPKPADVKLP